MAKHLMTIVALRALVGVSSAPVAEGFSLASSENAGPEVIYQTCGEALVAASRLPRATVSFPERTQTVIDSATVVTNVTLSGQASALAVRGTLLVDSAGFLVIRNLTLLPAAELAGVLSEGGLVFEESIVTEWENTVVTITGGVLTILNSTVEMNNGLFARLEKWAEVEACGVVFRSNSGGFLAYKSSDSAVRHLRVSKSKFLASQRQAVFQLSSAGQPSALVVTIENCEFANNSAVLLDLQHLSAIWVLRESDFSLNSNTAVQVVSGDSSGVVEGCTWGGNSGVLLGLTEFQGQVTFANNSISNHLLVPAISVSNREITAGCGANIVNSTFLDSTIKDASFLQIYHCEVEIRNCTLSHIVIAGLGTGNLVGVVSVTAGNLLIANCKFIENFVQYGEMNALFSVASVTNVSFVNSEHYSTNFSMLFVGSQASLTDVHISYTSAVPIAFETIVADRISFIVIEVSLVQVSALRVSGPAYAPAVFGVSYSTLTGSGVEVQGLRAMLVFYLNKARVDVKALTCRECELLHLLQGSGVEFRGEDIHLHHSIFSIRMFLVVGLSSLEIVHLHIENVTMEVFATCTFSKLTIRELWAQGCSFRLLLSDIVLSTVEVRNVRWDGVTGALLTAESSVVAFSNMRISEVSTNHRVVAVRSSAISFDGVHISKIKCQSLAEVSLQSSITFRNVSIWEQRAVEAVLIQAQSSAVLVDFSEFTNFNSCLIAAREGSVSLRDSVFRAGGVDAGIAWEFQDVHGALLQCTDCTTVEVADSKVQDLWTASGAAVYCGVEEKGTRVAVRNSYFYDCRGEQGGAISLTDVDAEIVDSTFEHCSATTRGGALFLSITRDYMINVTNSVFIGNTASEGGAIRWVDQPPSLARLIFTNNSAKYGPDIASYAVRISPKFEGPIPPGQFITVSFTLQDHYQQLVTYESSQFLSLIDSDHLTIIGISSKSASDGIVTYQGVSFLATPNSTQILHARYSSSVAKASPAFESETEVVFRDCILGEIKSNVSCNPCSVGNYSQSLEDRECRLCPEGADCPGGEVVTPKAGAWATNSSQQPIAICRIPELCLGTSRNLCREGYRGRVCEECEDGWFALVQFGCWTCPSSAWLLLLEPFVSVAFLILCIMWQLRLGSRESERHYSLPTLIYHMEFLSLLSFVRIDYPPSMQVYLHILLSLSTMSVASLPLQCYGVGLISRRMYGAAASFALLLLPAGIVTFRAILTRKWDNYRAELLIATTVVFRQIPFINCVLLLPLFNCDDGVDGAQRLVGSLHLRCWTQSHCQAALLQALPTLLISLLAPGAFLVWRCRVHSHKLPLLRDLRPMLHSFLLQLWTLLLCASVLVQRVGNSQIYLSLVALYVLAVIHGLSAAHIRQSLLFLSQSSFFAVIASYSLTFAYAEYREAMCLYVAIAVNTAFLLISARLQRRREAYSLQAPEFPPSQVLGAPHNSREYPADAELVVLELEDSKSLGC